MNLRHRGTLGAVVLTIALIGFAGAAEASNGNGNGQGNGNGNAGSPPATESSSSAAPSPGNSGNAPGRNKDSQASSQSQSSTQASASTPSSGHKGGGNQNSPSQPGVKPANNTAKSTSCTTGGSGSAVTCSSTGPISASASGKADASKKYGNGKTAAQIATKNGAAPGTKLYGPGNSQPHKVVTCGHRHGVDVHALKSHPAGKTCGSQVPPEQPPTPPTGCLCTSDSPHDPGAPPTSGAPPAPGSSPSPTEHKSSGNAAVRGGGDLQGVLASVAVVGHGDLPFTGFPLWAVVGIALVLIALGLTLRGPVPSRVKQGLEDRVGPRRHG